MFGAICSGALILMDQTRRASSLLQKSGQKLEAADGLAQPRLLPGSLAVSSGLASAIQEAGAVNRNGRPSSWGDRAEEALGVAGVGPVEDLRRVGQGHTEEVGPVRRNVEVGGGLHPVMRVELSLQAEREDR